MADAALAVKVVANLDVMRQQMQDAQAIILTTENAMKSMANAYDGTRTIVSANAAMLQVQALGGVSNLTQAELARLAPTLQAGIDKYAALGQVAPQAMLDLEDATKRAIKPTDDLGQSWVSRIAEGLLLRDAIRDMLSEIKNIAVDVPEQAHQLLILSAQTQINVEDLQVLSAATRQYGIDGDELGKALYQLSRRIAGNDDSVATAYHLMGMSLDEVRDLDPMTLFLTTERALGNLQGTIRDTAAADLYGGKLGVSLGAFSTGVDEAIAKARALNLIMDGESVKAASDYAEAMDRASHNWQTFVGQIEGGALQGVNVINEALQKGASWWQIASAMALDMAASNETAGGSASHLAALLDDLNQHQKKTTDIALQSADAQKQVKVALDAHGQAAQFMAALELDAAKAILPWQAEYLGHLKDIGELNAKNAAGIGVSANQLKMYEEDVKNAAEVEKQWKKDEDEANKIAIAQATELTRVTDQYYKTVNAASHDSVTQRVLDAYLAADAQIAAMEKAKTYSVEAEMLIWKAAEQTADNIIQKSLESDKYTREHYALLADQARIAYEFAMDHADSYTNGEMQALAQAYRDAERASQHWAAQASDDMDAAASHAKKTTGTVKDSLVDLMSTLSMADAALDGGIAKTIASVQTLAGAFITAAQAKAAFDSGGSFAVPTITVTPQNKASLIAELQNIEAEYALYPGRMAGGSGPTGIASTDSAAYAAMLQEQIRFAALKAALPGYADGVQNAPGGFAVVGERGPEVMYVPPAANIYPSGTSPAAVGGGTQVIQLVVDGRVLASIVNDQNTRLMKQSRQFPAA